MSDVNIKIFMLNERECWAATTLEEAVSAYQKKYGLTEADIEQDRPYFEEITDEGLQTWTYVDDPEEGSMSDNAISFKTQLRRMVGEDSNQFPCLFATVLD